MARTRADAAPRCNHFGYAGGLILVASSPKDCHNMHRDLEGACSPKELRSKPEKLQFWNNFIGKFSSRWWPTLKVEASMVFLGALLCRDRTGDVGYRLGLAWTKLWATTPV